MSISPWFVMAIGLGLMVNSLRCAYWEHAAKVRPDTVGLSGLSPGGV